MMAQRRSGWVRALGIGNLVVALVWAGVGWWLYREVGTRSLMLTLSEAMSQGLVEHERQHPADPRANERAGAASPQRPSNPLGVFSWSSPPPLPDRRAQREQTNGVAVLPDSPPTAAARSAFRPDIAEITRQIWGAFTACLIGIIAVAGLSLAFNGGRWSLPVRAALWIATALGAAALLAARYVTRAHTDWFGVVIFLTQLRYVWCGLVGLAVGTMAVLSLVALHPRRRAATWRGITTAAVFAGTLATLAALAVLIRYAGFPPLPARIYAVVAVAQSCWAWFLLIAWPRGMADVAPSDAGSAISRDGRPTPL